MENNNNLYRKLPKVDLVLATPAYQAAVQAHGKQVVTDALNLELERIRKEIPHIKEEAQLDEQLAGLEIRVLDALDREHAHLKRVLNATGVILHTNLGRAPMPEEAVKRAVDKMTGYTNLEYDLEQGARGERYSHFEKLICQVTGAEAAFAVNNNAAAVLLMMSAIGAGKEIPVSRGEQIEIGGKFRIPDIMDQSGCKRVEVGTTNKTRISDYEEAITEDTAALLKVHTSNFRIEGFTESVTREELVALGRKYEIPVMEDLGSGVLIDLSRYGLKKEPTVQESLSAGVDIVTFSGDKLFGGPQAGIIAGKQKWINLCKKHPMTRAMRIDKFTVAILEEMLTLYRDRDFAVKHIPVLKMLTATKDELQEKAIGFCRMLQQVLTSYQIAVVSCMSQAGGGSLPGEMIPGFGVRIWKENLHATQVEDKLREREVPLLIRIEKEGLLLDVRTLQEDELSECTQILKNVLE